MYQERSWFILFFADRNSFDDNPQKNNDLFKILSIIIGITGFVIMYFNYIFAGIAFIIGIVFALISQNKKLSLCLNIMGLILTIVLFFLTVGYIKNERNDLYEKTKCMNSGGYWENGKCKQFNNY